LVKIHNYLVTSVDEGHVGALVLLDLSSAFDTVDHQILIHMLKSFFSISDDALYLSKLSYSLVVASRMSVRKPDSLHVTSNYGVCDGSAVYLAAALSEWFRVKKGVLSPYLINILADMVMRETSIDFKVDYIFEGE